MSIQHQSLATGRWEKMSLEEQLANVGSEVERTISWKEKGNPDYSRKALERALELLSLTKNPRRSEPELKEISRVYEMLVDHFSGENRFQSTDDSWRKYFNSFAYLAAQKRFSAGGR